MFVFHCQNRSVLITLGIKGEGGWRVTDHTVSQVCAFCLVLFFIEQFQLKQLRVDLQRPNSGTACMNMERRENTGSDQPPVRWDEARPGGSAAHPPEAA